MKGLQATEIVALWEDLRAASPTRRAVELVAVGSGVASSEIEQWPLGHVDTALLTLRRKTYGETAACFVECPKCQAELEFEVELSAISQPVDARMLEPQCLEVDGARIEFRLPRASDLLAIERQGRAAAVDALFERCVPRATFRGDPVEPLRLPAPLKEAVATSIARLDPQLDLLLSLTCNACAHAWSTPFDIGRYLWRELEADAQRLLTEVDRLARVYGWSESAILRLGRRRRRAYLELVGVA